MFISKRADGLSLPFDPSGRTGAFVAAEEEEEEEEEVFDEEEVEDGDDFPPPALPPCVVDTLSVRNAFSMMNCFWSVPTEAEMTRSNFPLEKNGGKA